MILNTMVRRYQKRQHNRASQFNEIKRCQQRQLPRCKATLYVPREETNEFGRPNWMYTDVPSRRYYSEHLSQVILGAQFIDVCLILGIDWTQCQQRLPVKYRSLTFGQVLAATNSNGFSWNERKLTTANASETPSDRSMTLHDLWQEAMDQCDDYHMMYGPIDGAWNPVRREFMGRKARIGDEVEFHRRDTAGVRCVSTGPKVTDYELIPYWDDTHDVYAEPVEIAQDRPQLPRAVRHYNSAGERLPDTPQGGHPEIPTAERYDGDGRWSPMTQDEQDAVYEWDQTSVILSDKKEYSLDKPVQGLWMNPSRAKRYGVVVDKDDWVWDETWTTKKDGTRIRKATPRVFVDKCDII